MKKFEEGKNVERVGMGGNGQVGKLKIGEKNDNRYKPAEWLVCRKLTDDDIDGDDADVEKGKQGRRQGLPLTSVCQELTSSCPAAALSTIQNTGVLPTHPSHIRR